MRKLIHRIADGADLTEEQIPGQFLVEILGHDRVLIENHRGVREYGTEKIGVKSNFGSVVVFGKGLELCRMSREQLIIRGQIENIALYRRRC